ncbi:MAG: hypothetical protein AW07_03582 [Candidatus Accumulibacter sp. SK-11]|nr:MAG: hypothetical protein AW07_03582 [Candidatus Accumulibacter sp. SK-11]
MVDDVEAEFHRPLYPRAAHRFLGHFEQVILVDKTRARRSAR